MALVECTIGNVAAKIDLKEPSKGMDPFSKRSTTVTLVDRAKPAIRTVQERECKDRKRVYSVMVVQFRTT
jgi:hypothetical protein